jgi:hypothetical protein
VSFRFRADIADFVLVMMLTVACFCRAVDAVRIPGDYAETDEIAIRRLARLS